MLVVLYTTNQNYLVYACFVTRRGREARLSSIAHQQLNIYTHVQGRLVGLSQQEHILEKKLLLFSSDTRIEYERPARPGFRGFPLIFVFFCCLFLFPEGEMSVKRVWWHGWVNVGRCRNLSGGCEKCLVACWVLLSGST